MAQGPFGQMPTARAPKAVAFAAPDHRCPQSPAAVVPTGPPPPLVSRRHCFPRPRAPTFTVALIPSSTEAVAHLSTFTPTPLVRLCSPRSFAQYCTAAPQDLRGTRPVSPCCRRASAPTVRQVDDQRAHVSSAPLAFLRRAQPIIDRELRSPSDPSDATSSSTVTSRWPLTPPLMPTPT
jgi:hypothetical protein